MLLINLIVLAISIYLVYFLEKMKRVFKLNNKLVEFNSYLVEISMIVAALKLLIPWFIYLQFAIGIAIGIWGMYLCQIALEDCEQREFIAKLNSQHQFQLNDMKYRLTRLRLQEIKGCPMKLDCKQMGLRYKNVCENFETCNRYFRC